MKSAFLLATGAILAAAMPLDKRALETQWVTDIVTVTVTVDPSAPSSAGGVFVQAVSSQPAAAPTPQPQAPAPKPVYAAPPPPVSSPKPAPPPPSPAPAPAAPETTTVIVPAVQAPKASPEVAVKASPKPSPKPAPSPVAASSPKPAASSPAASSSSSNSGATDYQSAMLNEHNIHRANHSAPALEWDDQLAGFAQITASGCVFAHDMTEGGGAVSYGQNLASFGSSGDISGQQILSGRRGVTDQWYNDEMENWTYYGQANPPSGTDLDSWGHFTQVVWKGSTKVGCATVQCPAGSVLSLPSWYTVCNYGPPGNFGGEYGDNVLKPLGQPPVTV